MPNKPENSIPYEKDITGAITLYVTIDGKVIVTFSENLDPLIRIGMLEVVLQAEYSKIDPSTFSIPHTPS